MGLDFIQDNIDTLSESIASYEKAVKEKGGNSEEAKALKKLIVELCASFKKEIIGARRLLLKDAG